MDLLFLTSYEPMSVLLLDFKAILGSGKFYGNKQMPRKINFLIFGLCVKYSKENQS